MSARLAIVQSLALVLGLLAFGATVTLAYVGAFTDSTHAWQACTVSLFLTAICAGIFAGLEGVS